MEKGDRVKIIDDKLTLGTLAGQRGVVVTANSQLVGVKLDDGRSFAFYPNEVISDVGNREGEK